MTFRKIKYTFLQSDMEPQKQHCAKDCEFGGPPFGFHVNLQGSRIDRHPPSNNHEELAWIAHWGRVKL